MYEVVVVFNIIKWVLWSLRQRIPSKRSQTNHFCWKERYILRYKQRETPTKKTDGGFHLEREKRMFCWKTFILFFLLSEFFDLQESLWGLSQNLRLKHVIYFDSLRKCYRIILVPVLVMIVIINNYHVYHVVSKKFKIQKTNNIYKKNSIGPTY